MLEEDEEENSSGNVEEENPSKIIANKNNNISSRTTSVEDLEAGLQYLKRLHAYYEAQSEIRKWMLRSI